MPLRRLPKLGREAVYAEPGSKARGVALRGISSYVVNSERVGVDHDSICSAFTHFGDWDGLFRGIAFRWTASRPAGHAQRRKLLKRNGVQRPDAIKDRARPDQSRPGKKHHRSAKIEKPAKRVKSSG